jgi:hypothetical protein
MLDNNTTVLNGAPTHSLLDATDHLVSNDPNFNPPAGTFKIAPQVSLIQPPITNRYRNGTLNVSPAC